jgi:ABC-type Fe3+/spermidine/putrescine transport system ATPase subunit
VLRVRALGADRVTVGASVLRVAGALPAEGPVELTIRPERVRLVAEPGDNVLDARIEALVYQGAQTEVTARLADGQRVLVLVTEPAAVPLTAGASVRLHLPADAFMVLA